jgi:hypothetical protein
MVHLSLGAVIAAAAVVHPHYRATAVNVMFRGIDLRGKLSRPGDGDLRRQHLNVLHRLSTRSEEPGCQEGSGRKDQEWRQVIRYNFRPKPDVLEGGGR